MVHVGYRKEDSEVPMCPTCIISHTDKILELLLSIRWSYWKW